MLAVINDLPITEDMVTLMSGSKVKKKEMKALRLILAEQIGEIVKKEVREDFIDFYSKEIQKARKMGLTLVNQEVNEKTGNSKFTASDKFIKIMRSFFENLSNGGTQSNQSKKRIVVNNVDGTKSQSGSDADSQTSFYIIEGSTKRKAESLRKITSSNPARQ